jgi:hypothetical protein
MDFGMVNRISLLRLKPTVILLRMGLTAIIEIRRILNNRTLCLGGPGQWKMRKILKTLTLTAVKAMVIKATIVIIPPKKEIFVTALIIGRLVNATTRIKDRAITARKRIFLIIFTSAN